VGHRPTLPTDDLQNIRKVELALRIVRADERKRLPDLRKLEGVEPQVDEIDPLLGLCRVLFLDDPDDTSILCYPSQARRVLELRYQDRRPHPRRAVTLDEPGERLARYERPVAVHDEEDSLFVVYSLQSHAHCITCPPLFLLQDGDYP
jgi:hypothetical protein